MQVALQHGFRSAIGLPLKDEQANTFGSLNIYSAQPSAFTSEQIRLLEELAGDLAFDVIHDLALLRPDEILKILNLTGLYKRAEIFSYLDMDVQVELVSGESKKNVADLLMQMSPDDRADLFQHLEKNVADKLLLLLPLNERLDVIKLTSYLEETAGAIMTTDYATLLETDRVDLAIKKLRRLT